MRRLLLCACVLVGGLASADPVDLRVNGQPPLGAFGVDRLEHVHECAALGMNLVFTYKADLGRKQLDVQDPIGAAVAAHHMKVMYILAGRFSRVRLATDLSPTDTTIPVKGEEATSMTLFPPGGVLRIEGEEITYEAHTADAFTGCRRGANGTTAATHRKGLLLCASDRLRDDLLAVKDSPNLWGFWLVDDARPDEADSLREASRVIRQYDRRGDGTPYGHAIVMGIGGTSAMANFTPGVADAIGVYPYPYHKGQLNARVRRGLTYCVTRARSEQPDIGVLGVFQGFRDDEPNWQQMPTPEQTREDILSFLPLGAVGIMGFIWHWQRPGGEQWGFSGVPEVREAVGRTYADIREGKVKSTRPDVPAGLEWFRILTGDAARVSPGTPVVDYGDAAQVAALQKLIPAGRLTIDPQEFGGVRYPVRMGVSRSDPQDQKTFWPGLTLPARAMATTDWSSFSRLEQPLYNASAQTIPLRVWLAGAQDDGWSWSTVPIPPRTPVLLRLPLSEVAMLTDVSRVGHWMLWYDRPAEDYVLYLGSPVLVK